MLNLEMRKALPDRTPSVLGRAISKSLDRISPNADALKYPFVPRAWEDVAKFVVTENLDAKALIAKEAIGRIRDREKVLHKKLRSLDEESEVNAAKLAAIKTLLAWCEAPEFNIERASLSVFHKLKECWLSGDVMSDEPNASKAFFTDESQIFVIEHDWGKAFAGSKDFDDGEWPLPYDRCVFEFQITGKRFIVLSMRAEPVMMSAIAIQYGDYWSISKFGDMAIPPKPEDGEGIDKLYPVNKLLHHGVRALCIALDAEVAVMQLTRAPERLNSIREKAGKTLLSDFHTVNLARRSRVDTLPEHEPTGHHKRLHFRRGHWRHYEQHKTWIRWCLCGDPDLGFIDKQYRA